MIGPGHQPTPGEKRIYSLLNALSRREYFFRYEPQIVASGGSSKPDSVVVSARLGVLVIEVKDISATVAALEAQGAVFRSKPIKGPGGQQVLVEDPSGNPIELFQPRDDSE